MPNSPIYPFTATYATSSYVSGAIFIGLRDIVSGSFELANLGKPIVLFAIDPAAIPQLTGSLSASYSSSLG